MLGPRMTFVNKSDVSIFVLCVLLASAGCANAAPRPAVPETHPEEAQETASCEGRVWLASEPHVPLAQVTEQEIADGQVCCTTPTIDSIWSAVGPYGELLGAARVSAADFYDVTACFENTFEPTFDDAVAFAQGSWSSPPTARWEPTEAEQQSFFAFATSLDQVLRPAPSTWGEARLDPIQRRTFFFQIAADAQSSETHFAAFGGYAFAVAVLSASGDWHLSFLDTEIIGISEARLMPDAPARVLGVFDINGDGVPEIIGHWHVSDSFGDVVFECQVGSSYRPWRRTVQSPGGSTA